LSKVRLFCTAETRRAPRAQSFYVILSVLCASAVNKFQTSLSLLLAPCFLLALAACVPPGGSKPLLKIGLAAPFEGLYRSIGQEALYGVKLAIRERNALGGVGGGAYMVELVALNDEGESKEAAFQAREMAADPDVMGIIAGWSGDTAAAALPGYREAGLGVVVPWAVPQGLADREAGILLLAASREQMAEEAVRYAARTLRPARAVILCGAGGSPELLRQAAAGNGLRIVIVLSTSDPTWREQLDQQPQADLVLYDGAVADGAEALVALRQRGVTAPFVSGSELVGSVLLTQMAGEAAEGVFYASPAPAPADLGGVEGFVQGYRTLAGFEPGPRGVLAYDATNVLLDAVDAAIRGDGRPTRRGVIAGLGAVRRQGLTGPIAFDGAGRRENPPTWIYRIDGGRYPGLVEPLGGSNPAKASTPKRYLKGIGAKSVSEKITTKTLRHEET
jgi:branched-chain amino acid transport system substrate-binding protein